MVNLAYVDVAIFVCIIVAGIIIHAWLHWNSKGDKKLIDKEEHCCE